MLDAKFLTFMKAAELRSFTLAAQALHVTQPAVTQHIRKLEEYYGCRLVDFTGRQMSLTAAGALLYRYGLLQTANERELRERLDASARTLRAGATLSIADYYLPELLGPFLRERPGALRLRVGNTEEMLQACLRGELDCAFIEGVFDAELFTYQAFCHARFLPVAAAGHPLAGRPVRLAELFAYPLVLREPGSGTRTILENRLHEENLTPSAFHGVVECGNFRMIKEILRQTQAVSFMYEQVAREEVAAGVLTFLNVTDAAILRPLVFAYPRHSLLGGDCRRFFETYIAAEPEKH